MKRCLACDGAFQGDRWQCPRCGWAPTTSAGVIAFSAATAHANDGFVPSAFSRLFELECRNFWFRGRNKIIRTVLEKYFPNTQSVLEVGCGTGYVLQELERIYPDSAVAGTDQLVAGLEVARSRLNRAVLYQMDGLAIPFVDEFGLICAFDVIEHIDEDARALRQMWRALRPGGGLVITVPQHMFLWSRSDEFAQHKRRYDRKTLTGLVTRAGFSPMYVTSFVTTLLPLLIVSRFMARWKRAPFEPEAEFRIGRAVNHAFERCLDFERALIARGVSLPLGGSLLVVARKVAL